MLLALYSNDNYACCLGLHGIISFWDQSLMAVDFGQQYISFFGLLKNAFLTGDLSSLSYSFTKSLGGDMIGVLGYYLMSPFNIIYILTPLKHFGFAVFLTIWLRYGAIGMAFAFLLIKRYKGLEKKKMVSATIFDSICSFRDVGFLSNERHFL